MKQSNEYLAIATRNREICESAAYLIASIVDPRTGPSQRYFKREVRDSIILLKIDLEKAGFMERYRIENGTFGLPKGDI